MSTELLQYKSNRLYKLKANYIYNYNYIVKYYTNIINALNRSTKLNKLQQITIVKKYLAVDLNTLLNTYNNNINIIKNFIPTQIIINKSKKALLIGINYIGTQNELYGCINDVNCIKERISKNGFTNINILTDLTTTKPTRINILKEFKNLLINSQSGDLLFFLYSGHGSYILDKNKDEDTKYDQMIVPLDLQGIIDDELKSIIQTYLKKNVTLFAMFDSCFSGSVLDLKYQYLDSLNFDSYIEHPAELETAGNVIMISGCNDEQTSADASFNNKANGAMTWSFLETLKQKPTESWRELIKNMRSLLKTSEFDQIPQLSSGTFVDIDSSIFI